VGILWGWPGVPQSISAVRRDQALLESAAARPFQTAFLQEVHRGLLAKGAALFHSLITNHPFEDGNKRTAVTSLQLFLVANDVLLLAGQADMYNLAIGTASAGERRESPEFTLRTIKGVLNDNTATLSEIRQIKAYRNLYEQARSAKLSVRNHPLNAQSKSC
jgi:death-on-curing family protein